MEALEIAKYIITKSTIDGKPVNNIRLQQLLYYIQKEFLQKKHCPAFDDVIEVCAFGPKIPEVYFYFCGFGSMDITYQYDVKLPEEYENIINRILFLKRNLEPWDTAEDIQTPGKAWSIIWKNGAGKDNIIPNRLISERG